MERNSIFELNQSFDQKNMHMKRVLSLISVLAFLMLFASCKVRKPFTLAVLPDTQTYTRLYPDLFKAQTAWVAEQADSIVFALQLGDITDHNNEKQWKAAAEAFQLMDGKVPYAFVPGNHDLGTNGSADVRDATMMNTWLPYSKYSKTAHFGGAFEEDSMENTWHTFNAGGYKWLVLALEFGPRNEVIDWAAKVLEAHPKHKAILITHAYMYSDETRMGEGKGHKWLPQAYGLGKATGAQAVNDGEQMWDKLVSRHKNIVFVFSGHVLNDGVGTLVSTGQHGNKVYQMLSNYQSGVEGSENGGNGFLRLVTVFPQEKKIRVKTYSPHLDQYNTDAHQQFEFENVELD